MLFILLFTDAADADPDIRKTYMHAHLAFLEAHTDQIEAAGPLSDPEGKGRDGLWIVRADSPEEAERLVHEDPFWPTGLCADVAIIPWRQVFAKGARLI